jgi:hypothetical protein
MVLCTDNKIHGISNRSDHPIPTPNAD